MTDEIVDLAIPGVNGLRMCVYSDGDRYISEKIRSEKSWDKPMTDFFRQWLKPASTVVDVGANIGYTSLLAGKIVGPLGKVYSFEPHPANYDMLVKNIALNRLGHVRPFRLGIGHHPADTKLYVSNTNQGGHSALRASEFGAGETGDYQSSVDMKIVSLSEFLPTLPSFDGHVDLIKIDAEGLDISALASAREVIRANRNHVAVAIELWPQAHALSDAPVDPLFEIAADNGFDMWASTGDSALRPYNTALLADTFLKACEHHFHFNLILTPSVRRIKDLRFTGGA